MFFVNIFIPSTKKSTFVHTVCTCVCVCMCVCECVCVCLRVCVSSCVKEKALSSYVYAVKNSFASGVQKWICKSLLLQFYKCTHCVYTSAWNMYTQSFLCLHIQPCGFFTSRWYRMSKNYVPTSQCSQNANLSSNQCYFFIKMSAWSLKTDVK